jgi:hypothetical protein
VPSLQYIQLRFYAHARVSTERAVCLSPIVCRLNQVSPFEFCLKPYYAPPAIVTSSLINSVVLVRKRTIPNYTDPEDPGSIPGATRFSEK